jgi:tellurium resistance protein TerD
MAINLVKGQRINIGLTELKVELGWSVDPDLEPAPDPDVSTFILGSNGKAISEDHFVFFGSENRIMTPEGERPVSPDGSVIGAIDDLGDDEDGDGKGQEDVDVFLDKASNDTKEMVFVVTIYNHTEGYNFGQIRDSYVKIINSENNDTLAIYELDEDFSTETSVEFGRIYKKDSDWKFEAIGKGYNQGLDYLVKKYGLEVK